MTDSYITCLSIFKALSDPTRLEIVLLIRDAEPCARELLEHFSFSQPTLSYHMRVLGDAGLITARKEGLCVRYALKRDHLDYAIRILSAVTKPVRPDLKIGTRPDKSCRVAAKGATDDKAGI